MTVTITDPQPISLTQSAQLVQPQSGGSLGLLVIDNLSGFLVRVSVGAQTFYQAPLVEDAYDLTRAGGQPITISAVQLPENVNETAGTIAPTWYSVDEPKPGTNWPIALSGPAEIAASILATGIPNVNIETVLVNNAPLPAGGSVGPIDITKQASLTIYLEGGTGPVNINQYDPENDHIFTETLVSTQPGQSGLMIVEAIGTYAYIDGTFAGAGYQVTVIGSNRPARNRVSVEQTTSLGDFWSAPSAAYTVGQTVDLVHGAQYINTQLQGLQHLDFHCNNSTLKGTLFLTKTLDNSSHQLALAGEMVVSSTNQNAVNKLVAVPAQPYTVHCAITSAGTGSIVASFMPAVQ